MSRGKDQIDYAWDTEEKAKLAKKLADAKWPANEEFQPKGEVVRFTIIDEMLELSETGEWWGVMEEGGEYMVNRHTNEWECVV